MRHQQENPMTITIPISHKLVIYLVSALCGLGPGIIRDSIIGNESPPVSQHQHEVVEQELKNLSAAVNNLSGKMDAFILLDGRRHSSITAPAGHDAPPPSTAMMTTNLDTIQFRQ